MFKKLAGIAVVVSLALSACGGTGTSSSAADKIKIGGGFALTGDEASLDVPAANGAKLAVKEINASGGVLGKQIDFIIHDSQYKVDIAQQTAKQFVEQDKVQAMIGYTDTDSISASGPTIQAAGIPFITVGATSPKIPTQVGDVMFLACFGDNVQAAVGAEYALKNFGKNAYLLFGQGGRVHDPAGGLLQEPLHGGGRQDRARGLLRRQGHRLLGADRKDQGPLAAAGLLLRRRDALQRRPGGQADARRRDRPGPIVGGDGYDTPDLVKVAGAAANNVFFTTHALMDATNGTDGIKKFMAAYKAEYGNDPENAFAALGYDTVYLLADAIKRAGSMDSAALKKAIEATKDFPGITGKITFAAGSHVPQKGVTVIEVKDQKFTLAGEVVPEKVPAP